MAGEMKQDGLGRRKEAVAQVHLTKHVKSREVNGKPFAEYFDTVAQGVSAILPLTVTSQDEAVGFAVVVHGGGKQGQADAMSLGLARALLAQDEGRRKELRVAGLLTRDSRVKERKKPGLKRARRAPQFSKR